MAIDVDALVKRFVVTRRSPGLRSSLGHLFRPERGAAEVAGVMDDVVNQPEESIDEIVPRAGVVLQAPLKQVAVHAGQGHGGTLRRRERRG